jgi:AbrB family looped-hinge helix DNA binding protein
MTAQTKLSAKGQVVIPMDVRDRLGWSQGSALEVIETGEGVLLRRKRQRKKLTVDEALEQIAAKVHYDGPPLPVEDLGFSADVYRDWISRKR